MIIPFYYATQVPGLYQKLGVCLLLLLFTYVYLFSWNGPYKTRMLSIYIEIVILLFIGGYYSPWYFWLMFYPSAALGTLKQRDMLIGIIFMVTTSLLEFYFLMLKSPSQSALYWPIVLSGIISVTGAAYGTHKNIKVQQAKRELEEANAQIERLTKIAERERISQDLHDIMGHQLSMITLKSQLAQKLLERDRNFVRAQAEIKDIETAARVALSRVREYVSDIRQPDFDEEWKAAVQLLETAGIRCKAMHSEQLCPHSKSYQVLAMCLRESVTNIVRHSNATDALIQVTEQSGQIYLLVADNGKGLEGAAQALHDGRNTGNGINGMRARLTTVDGRMAFWNHGKWIEETGMKIPFTLPWGKGAAILMMVPNTTKQISPKEVLS